MFVFVPPLPRLYHPCHVCTTPATSVPPLPRLYHPCHVCTTPATSVPPLPRLYHPCHVCTTPATSVPPLPRLYHPCHVCTTPATSVPPLPRLPDMYEDIYDNIHKSIILNDYLYYFVVQRNNVIQFLFSLVHIKLYFAKLF